MKAECVNSFLTSAKYVWHEILGCTLNLQSYFLVIDRVTTSDVTAIIRLKGGLEGEVLYGFDAETAQSVVAKMTGTHVDDLN